ncbi:hypothetical protein TEA_023293 [Camellia sinensis var. sinensis]|uniref:DNA2/NAM7 helicase helicase domain-containing protein n=1 Tax=Camellia sinensis var. sinensis TaxID=542762 RepID=A0A4S4DTI6_CAMSN|nr:hypothetical protein TEA_023293 [Camellia sinensis var. sinensis]
MGSRERRLFDLNELPGEDEETDGIPCLQPQRAIPSSNTNTTDLFATAPGPQIITNNHAFSHASSVSGFQPFVRSISSQGSLVCAEQIRGGNWSSEVASSSKTTKGDGFKAAIPVELGSAEVMAVEKEEGEWSDAEGCADTYGSTCMPEQSLSDYGKELQEKGIDNVMDHCDPGANVESVSRNDENIRDENSDHTSLGLDLDTNDQKSNSSRNSEGNCKGDISVDGQEESGLVPKQKDVKGVEASHALKCAITPGKRPRFDQHKEAMLGKKRSRQTMFLNLEDVKQAGPIKTSTPRRQTFPAPVTIRTVKEARSTPPAERTGEKQSQPMNKDSKQVDLSCNEGNTYLESNDSKSECNGDMNSGLLGRPRRLNSATDLAAELRPPSIPRQSSWKQPTDSKQLKNSQASTRKPALIGQSSTDSKLGTKKLPSKKQTTVNTQYQDTSVERLLREVTNEKFWHHPGWYDVIVLPANDCKWNFKEGDVAVLSTPRPGAVRSKRSNNSAIDDDEDPDVSGRVAGTVRRYIPIDTRDPPGAILHFYVGDYYDPNSKVDNDHILRKFQLRGMWFLTVLGSLATTQREYVALHAFRRLNLQMQTAILQPSPEHFPKYEEQPPAMPECFTPGFVDHLRRTFNGPQLAAIQWAAMHTAAGTSSGTTKRQDPWPFTLVQGPPGTGKTHTVWGMLNVIHLVQYQHYYTALLKKLAPESYKQASEGSSDNVATGSIDEVLQSMDQNLFRTLPKLCPKPRMLVCAPSNAATDELLARVLDRGFIDGEMKVYRPDVARVGVDSQTRAAQAVSVERRTEQLLVKSRDEIYGWMHQLRAREAQLSQQMACLQRELNVAAAAGRAQGSVMGNANALVKSDDWAALITDAKARNCYLNMDSLPKDFLMPKAPAYVQSGKVSSNLRSLRSGVRHRSFDPHMESRSGTPSEDDEKSNAPLILKNGNYRSSKPPMENGLDDLDQSGDKSRDAWQYGIQKRPIPAAAGVTGKRDL